MGDAVHHLSQGDEIGVAVFKRGPRRANGMIAGNGRDGAVVPGPAALAADFGAQPGAVGHQFFDGDPVLAVAVELRQVLGDGGVEIHQAGIHQLHHRVGGGHHLGQGGEIKDGVIAHGVALGDQGAVPEGLAVDDFPLVPHQDDGTGEALGGDFLTRHRIDAVIALIRSESQGLRLFGGRRLLLRPHRRPCHWLGGLMGLTGWQ